jgi:hypothetical protein
MRRLVLSIIVASGLVVVGPGSASAEPAPTTAASRAVPGKKVCKIEDSRLTALSGMVATRDGFVVINDGVPLDSGKKIFFLDNRCTVRDTTSFGGNGPRDTEDMVLSPGGKTLWIADTGDNKRERETVGLWSMPADGSTKPKIHRLSYPAGDRHDAEALLLSGDGTPILITKEINRPGGLYVPSGPLKTDNTDGVRLTKVGEVAVPPSSTPASGVAALGRGMIVGAAIAPDGSRVALRTYTDALEFDVTDGDVLAALKKKPRVTPLPNEPFGEALTYSADGKTFLTVSDMDNLTSDDSNWILRYTPGAAAATLAGAGAATTPAAKGQSWLDKLTLDDITYLIGAVGLLGALLVGFGIAGIVRSRRRASSGPVAGGPVPPDAAATARFTPARPPGDLQGAGQRGGVYGGGRPAGPPPGPNIYAKPAPPPGSGVYGAKPAGRPGGGVYGAPPPAGPPTRPAGPPTRPAGPPTRPSPPGT